MAVNLIQKHGLVPASIFPESESSGSTLAMNNVLKNVLRTAASEIRHMRQSEGATVEKLRLYKDKKICDIWRILAMHLGTPPEKFSWSYYEKKDDVHVELTDMTPQSFVAQYVDEAFSSYVCLVNDPRNPYVQTYTVDYLQVGKTCKEQKSCIASDLCSELFTLLRILLYVVSI